MAIKKGNPKATVLMPVYNGEDYLRESVESILNQKFSDFEFLIINDGSTDKSSLIIDEYAGKDKRIKRLDLKVNRGYVYCLNQGLHLSELKYVARMDADDISMPDRLEKQVGFMEANPGIGVCGTWLKTFGAGKKSVWATPLNHDGIFAGMLFESMIYHPTVMIRREKLLNFREFYKPEYMPAEDYEFWVRLGLAGVRFSCIPEVLYRYRQHGKNVSRIFKAQQKENSSRVRESFLEALKILPEREELILHNGIVNGMPADSHNLQKAHQWFEKIAAANKRTGTLDHGSLEMELGRRWFFLCCNSAGLGLFAWHEYGRYFYGQINRTGIGEKLRFFLKCILRINKRQDLFSASRGKNKNEDNY